MAGGIFQIFVGLVAIVFGFAADAFYPAFMRRPKPDEKPVPKWLGRTISVAVGVVFILSGLSDLRHAFLHAQELAAPILISHNDIHGPLGGERRVEDIRVYQDGKVVYLEEANENRELKMVKNRYEVTLDQQQLQGLITLLQGKGIRSLPSKIPRQTQPIDFFWQKSFEISHNGSTQNIKIVSFYPFLNERGKVYPQALIELECTLQEIQAKARGMKEGPEWCADLLKNPD